MRGVLYLAQATAGQKDGKQKQAELGQETDRARDAEGDDPLAIGHRHRMAAAVDHHVPVVLPPPEPGALSPLLEADPRC